MKHCAYYCNSCHSAHRRESRAFSRLWILSVSICVLLGRSVFAQEVGTEFINAFTEPYQILDLAAAESGIMQSILVQQGDQVAAGDLIATLNNDVLLAQLEIAKVRATLTGQIKKARADVDQKQRRFGKLVSLHTNGHASEEELDSAQSSLEIAQAGLLEALENQKLAKLERLQIEAQLRRRQITSPVAGQVIKLEKDRGEYVASLEPVVAQVVQLDKLRVKFYIDTLRAAGISKGDHLSVLLINQRQSVPARVEFVSPVTEADSRTVRIEVVINNADGKYRAGVPVRLGGPFQANRSGTTTALSPINRS